MVLRLHLVMPLDHLQVYKPQDNILQMYLQNFAVRLNTDIHSDPDTELSIAIATSLVSASSVLTMLDNVLYELGTSAVPK